MMNFFPTERKAIDGRIKRSGIRSSKDLPTSLLDVEGAMHDTFVFEDLSTSDYMNSADKVKNQFETIKKHVTPDVRADMERTAITARTGYSARRFQSDGLSGNERRKEWMKENVKIISELKSRNPKAGIKTFDEIEKEIAEQGRVLREKYEDVSSRATPGKRVAGSLLGAMRGSFQDPFVLSTLWMGAVRSASILRSAWTGFKIGAGTELAIQPLVYNYKKKIDSPYSFNEAALNVLAVGIGGAIFEGGIKSLIKGYDVLKAKGKIKTTPDTDAARDVLEQLDEVMDESPFDNAKPENRDAHVKAFDKAIQDVGEGKIAEVQEIVNPVENKQPESVPAGKQQTIEEKVRARYERGETISEDEYFKYIRSDMDPEVRRAKQEIERSREPDIRPDKSTSRTIVEGLEIQKVNSKEISVKPEELQFKKGINPKTGEQKPLKGEWDATAAGIVTVWQDKAGILWAVNGHHRVALANRLGGKDMLVNVLREADGFTIKEARKAGAELNIKEGKGTIYDHADFFRESPEITEEQASQKGIAGKGFILGRQLSDDLYTSFRTGQITPDIAYAIARGAKEETGLQQVGLQYALKNPSAKPDQVENLLKALKASKPPSVDIKGQQADIFFTPENQAWIKKAEDMARIATREISDIRKDITALGSGKTAERAQRAKKGGIEADPATVQKKLAELNEQKVKWENWEKDPILYAEVEKQAGYDKAEVKKAPKSNQEVMTEDEYLASRGAPFMKGAEPALHRTPGGFAKGQREKYQNQVQEDMKANNKRREELRKEYAKKLESGEIREPTRTERLTRTAEGDELLESTQAARRLLEKRGKKSEKGIKTTKSIEDVTAPGQQTFLKGGREVPKTAKQGENLREGEGLPLWEQKKEAEFENKQGKVFESGSKAMTEAEETRAMDAAIREAEGIAASEDIEIPTDVRIDENGKQVIDTKNAREALREADREINVFKKIEDCLQ